MWQPDERIIPYIARAGFYGWTTVQNTKCDWDLLNALIERWRSETHTFHLTCGEATVSLQDVSMLTGLPIEGRVVTGSDVDLQPVCMSLLGDVPETGKSANLGKLTWFAARFQQLPPDPTEIDIHRAVRAYILCMLGTTLMPDLSSSHVPLHYLPLLEDVENIAEYSWGSAVLAFLYRQLCCAVHEKKAKIAGCMVLLQLWSWERIPIGRPIGNPRKPEHVEGQDPHLAGTWATLRWEGPRSYVEVAHGSLMMYRDQLDRMHPGVFEWMPYDEDLIWALNTYCAEGRAWWASEVPLINYNIVEWHLPNRVLRQFGRNQMIPPDARGSSDPKHMVTRRARKNWAHEMRDYIDLWSRREEFVVLQEPNMSSGEEFDVTQDYNPWYDNITRRFIQPQFDNCSQSSYIPASHNIPRSASRWISAARSAARIFLDPDMSELRKQDAYIIFHNAVAELTDTGYDTHLDVDPRLIEFPQDDCSTGHGGYASHEFPEPDITQQSSYMDDAGPSNAPTPQPRRGRHRQAPDRYTPGSIRHGRGHR